MRITAKLDAGFVRRSLGSPVTKRAGSDPHHSLERFGESCCGFKADFGCDGGNAERRSMQEPASQLHSPDCQIVHGRQAYQVMEPRREGRSRQPNLPGHRLQ